MKKEAQTAQLYDLEADPNQTQNVYADHPEIVARMDARLLELKEENLAKK